MGFEKIVASIGLANSEVSTGGATLLLIASFKGVAASASVDLEGGGGAIIGGGGATAGGNGNCF